MAKDDGKAAKEAAQEAVQVLAKIGKQVEKANRIAAVAVKNPAAGAEDLQILMEDLGDMADDAKGVAKDLKTALK